MIIIFNLETNINNKKIGLMKIKVLKFGLFKTLFTFSIIYGSNTNSFALGCSLAFISPHIIGSGLISSFFVGSSIIIFLFSSSGSLLFSLVSST